MKRQASSPMGAPRHRSWAGLGGGQSLQLSGVRLGIGEQVLVGRLDATVAPGACLVVMGPSGCGKSSLLAWMAGTLDPVFSAAGRVMIGDDDLSGLPPQRRRLGLLFQDDLLFPHLTVAGNLLFALPPDVRPSAHRRATVEDALAQAGLAGMAARDPGTLSGGQRARVALLRTLLARPRALLLDEPFGKLDATLRGGFRQMVFDHAAARRLPMLLVTHDAADADAAVAACGAQVLRLGEAA
ncbi:MAG: ATP-binding cassette domain-containing protein [Aquabacterium sp.]